MMAKLIFKRYFVIIAIAAIFLLITAGAPLVPKAPLGPGIVVDTAADQYDSDPGHCSLREAIQAENISAPFGGCPEPGNEIIYLPVGDYYLTITGSGEDDNAKGDLDIKNDMVIYNDSTTSSWAIIHGSGDRVFDVHSGAVVTLNRIYVTGGGSVGWGAGIFNQGYLTLDGTLVEYNNSTANGGGITSDSGASLTLHDSYVGYNTSVGQGGGIEVYLGNFTCDNSVIEGNQAHKGGGVYLNTFNDTNHATITQCYIGYNYASVDGGGIYNGGATTINRSILEQNSTAGGGGNILNLTIDFEPTLYVNNTDILYGSALQGGGIENYGDANVYISYSTIAGNQATYFGGAGIFQYNSSGDVYVEHATIADNTLVQGGVGSAIALLCDSCTGMPVVVNNSILSGPVDKVCYGDVDIDNSHYNIETSDTCNFEHSTNYVNTITGLGALSTYPSTYKISYLYQLRPQTYSIARSSLAVDTAHCAGIMDQNGLPAPVDGNWDSLADCDRGAFELQNLHAYIPLIKKP